MRYRGQIVLLLLVVGTLFTARSSHSADQADSQKKKDPAAWGSTHAGKPVPDFTHGDECLFCHRNDIGPGWSRNPHALTVRQREDAPLLDTLLKGQKALAPIAGQVGYFMGSRHHIRFLNKSGYNRFDILNAQASLSNEGTVEKLVDAEHPSWIKDKFANQCAGCHSTGIDAQTKTFAYFGLDCYTCHGVVDLEHTGNTALIFLSKKQRGDAQAITSTCASCHLRGGKSRSLQTPYPNNFVPADNLFKDYEVDWSKADDASLNPGDRHIYQNARDVVINGSEFPTCISCHDVHKASSVKHHRAPRTAMCSDCHEAEGQIKGSKPYTVHSVVCEY